MKSFLIVGSLFLFCLVSGVHQDEISSFKIFKEKYFKKYENIAKELKALLHFAKAFQLISDHNKAFLNGDVGFDLAMNKFADLSPEETSSFSTGTQLPIFNELDFLIRPKAVSIANLSSYPPGPPAVDWNAKGHVTAVKDQGYYCNSCWAFSTCAALESALSITYGKLVQVSEQFLIDCNRNDQTGNFGCNGGSQASAYLSVTYAPGIPSQDSYPYQENVQHSGIYPCRYDYTTSVGTTLGYERILRDSNFSEDKLKDYIASQGPVAFGMNADLNTFVFYSSGIYDDPNCKPSTAHSALIYGYGTAVFKNGTTVDYWMCKNSWSSDWGNRGFFRMVRGKNMCGLSSYLIRPVV